ncbi:FK506-binding protein 4 [Cryptococcus deuterogattii 99/473]|uniref:FK506-binding protein 4 n=1 Tax=Cryptococcus deuterogattii Ram5 TaxID=1296110 RepID=A0A0D0T9S6_9TREE|nr:FK506-binding protein 4 [Cryptococcus deuterogattii LA55]KIR36255.1 FK506-binding protein 4 [Cryptococcus deuterogattii MMRL2647]KIR42787.1 FK506-binding protein 4 [Cryptococcus deuterogattii Ram5]KIR75687.1 FK506-binding protein 4 [Cryptococcus deuterogattii CA1014]KIR95628.1 FK506-binding protein 4 [Cryptococcus deuterogattii CBS 10090]KIS02124.1 FK506-binding protein 4 [Cryptococcus deuterogattii 2001/935-1]KIY59468.1 FK506-binding protein 4 [Cryptococcus deuterogattii 99/473]
MSDVTSRSPTLLSVRSSAPRTAVLSLRLPTTPSLSQCWRVMMNGAMTMRMRMFFLKRMTKRWRLRM